MSAVHFLAFPKPNSFLTLIISFTVLYQHFFLHSNVTTYPLCTHIFFKAGQSLIYVCLQVHSGGDARLVQHHPSLQEESFYDDCHRVGPGLRCLLSPAVWFQHHRSGQQHSDLISLSRRIIMKSQVIQDATFNARHEGTVLV